MEPDTCARKLMELLWMEWSSSSKASTAYTPPAVCPACDLPPLPNRLSHFNSVRGQKCEFLGEVHEAVPASRGRAILTGKSFDFSGFQSAEWAGGFDLPPVKLLSKDTGDKALHSNVFLPSQSSLLLLISVAYITQLSGHIWTSPRMEFYYALHCMGNVFVSVWLSAGQPFKAPSLSGWNVTGCDVHILLHVCWFTSKSSFLQTL